ncbi:MAG: carboxymuconolactone decarboxylase family protein [Gemmatimonadota bacterium]
MSSIPEPPQTFKEFAAQYPKLAEAWEKIAQAGGDGPLDKKTARLVKLGVAMGAMREGAVHSSARKARAIGITQEEIDQVVALAAGTLGLPSTVAVWSWVNERDRR